jgi:hypothetical protein
MDDNVAATAEHARTWNRWWSRSLFVFGLLFLAIGLVLLARELAFGREAVVTGGSVVELRVTESADGQNTTPVVEFKTREGALIRFEGQSTRPAPSLGDHIPVIYRPNDPQHARIDTFVQRWLMPCAFTPLGFLICLAGIYRARAS